MAVRRPRLRLRQVPPHPAGSGHHTEDRPSRCPARLGAGQDTLGRGADLRLAPPVQTAADPLRDTRRSPPRPASTRLQHHLLATPPSLILKRSVNPHPRSRKEPGVWARSPIATQPVSVMHKRSSLPHQVAPDAPGGGGMESQTLHRQSRDASRDRAGRDGSGRDLIVLRGSADLGLTSGGSGLRVVGQDPRRYTGPWPDAPSLLAARRSRLGARLRAP